MANLKYGPGEVPIVNKHGGYTFQPSNYGQTMKTASKSARWRYPNQSQRQQNLQKAVRHWRDMDISVKNTWNNFAITYPQASRRNPDRFLTGYQLFLKRNHYCFLNYSINEEFMKEPIFEELPDPGLTFEITQGSQSIDVTDLYIKNFGLLPEPGQWLLLKAYPIAEFSGQFFEPIEQAIQVSDVYFDGLFVNLSFDLPPKSFVVSLYLSKTFRPGVKYSGTKTRYMGCFSPKTFLLLTDTPDSYDGQAGKIPAVNDTEDGLEFIDAGGGGGNAFNPIKVSGQSDVTANQAATPLTLVEGDGVTILTDPNFRKITFSAATSGAYCQAQGVILLNGIGSVHGHLSSKIASSKAYAYYRMSWQLVQDSDNAIVDRGEIEVFGYNRSGNFFDYRTILAPSSIYVISVLPEINNSQYGIDFYTDVQQSFRGKVVWAYHSASYFG